MLLPKVEEKVIFNKIAFNLLSIHFYFYTKCFTVNRERETTYFGESVSKSFPSLMRAFGEQEMR